MITQRRAVFLDRDDTIIVDEGYMHDPARVVLVPGARQALLRLGHAGLHLVLVSNQSGVARGLVTPAQVLGIQRRMCTLLEGVHFSGFEYCFHHPDERCPCRKPAPTMILRAAARLGLELGLCVMVGDKESDVEAGRRAGCRTALVSQTPAPTSRADLVAADLEACADWILGQRV